MALLPGMRPVAAGAGAAGGTAGAMVDGAGTAIDTMDGEDRRVAGAGIEVAECCQRRAGAALILLSCRAACAGRARDRTRLHEAAESAAGAEGVLHRPVAVR